MSCAPKYDAVKNIFNNDEIQNCRYTLNYTRSGGGGEIFGECF